MRVGTVCSGIGAPECAWSDIPGWEFVWQAEIEKFPASVLRYRFPGVENLGDMTKLKGQKKYDESVIDLLCGGTPCQSFSIAGLRGGLDDDRGNLALEFCRILIDKQPRWFVWENVPGVFSSGRGEDFAAILGAFQKCGYSFAYRVLDAQYFGVAQRRRRVFVVGCLGDDWRAPAAVLFDRESLRGDITPRRKKRKEVAGMLTGGLESGGPTPEQAAAGHIVPVTRQQTFRYQNNVDGLVADDFSGTVKESSATTDERSVPAYVAQRKQEGEWWDGSKIAATLTKQNAGGGQRMPDKGNFGAVITRAKVSEQARPAQKAGTLDAHYGDKQGLENQHIDSGASKFVPYVKDVRNAAETKGVCQSLQANAKSLNAMPITLCFVETQITSKVNGSNPDFNDPSHPLTSGGLPPTVIQLGHSKSNGLGISETEAASTLEAASSANRAIAFQSKASASSSMNTSEIVPTLDRSKAGGTAVFCESVRRLTPLECERLQGFPDNWTAIPNYNSKHNGEFGGNKGLADGPRYRSIGNSMAVPVMKWLGKRIDFVDKLIHKTP